MTGKKYIILNFTHGNGPFLRTMELALAINNLFEKRGLKRFGIIVPWVYKTRQKTILQENFKKNIKKHPGEILLDERLGECLGSVFYGEKTYEESLKSLLKNHESINNKIKSYLSGGLITEDFSGNKVLIDKNNIAMEINRCPVVSFGMTPSYYTSFAFMSEIFERSLGESAINIDKEILKKLIPYYSELERKQTICFIAEPATFTYLGERPKRYDKEIYTPPSTNQSLNHRYFFVRSGAYVTVTGITGINKRLFKELNNVGLKVYTNKPGSVQFSKKARPTIVFHKNILLHFARVGWGSAWLSQLTGTPLVALPYDPKDDPEVYFNNICIEKIGLGKVYTGQPIEELLKFRDDYRERVKSINNKLLDKYGTLNGVEYTAEKIVDHFTKLKAAEY